MERIDLVIGRTRRASWLPGALRLLIVAAGGLALWAALDDPFRGCLPCGALDRRLPLGWLRLVCYSSLLVLSFRAAQHKAMRRSFEALLIASVAVHAFLLASLLARGAFCPKCALAGGVALAILSLYLCAHRADYLGLCAGAALGGVCIVGVLFWTAPVWAPAWFNALDERVFAGRPVVTYIVLLEPGSLAASRFEAETTPVLKSAYGPRINIRRYQPSDFSSGARAPVTIVAWDRRDYVAIREALDPYSARRLLDRVFGRASP